jgi:hypothetical protein
MASESRSSAGADRSEPSPAGNDPAPHIGAYLAGQRKLRGISRQELADLTRIPIRSLERLESGLFDNIDDGFVRGFVRTVSSALGLDPDESLTRMLPEPVGPGESPFLQRIAIGRVLMILGCAVIVAGSVGMVSSVIRPVPNRRAEEPEGLRRRDPVRALALSELAVGIPAEVVVASSPISRTTAIEAPAPEAAAPVAAASRSAASEAAAPESAASESAAPESAASRAADSGAGEDPPSPPAAQPDGLSPAAGSPVGSVVSSAHD